MKLNIFENKGVPIEQQRFTWKELAGPTYSKLNDDAFTRVRVILMNGIESNALRVSHAASWSNGILRPHLARLRRIEHHQQTMVNWLNPPDQSPLETTIAFEQVAIEVTASVAQNEPDPYLASIYRFGMLEDFDHLYRYSALMDRVEGKDANNILQSYTDVCPGRPTSVEHRDPSDDLRIPYERHQAPTISKINALTITGAEFQTHDYYMTIGPTFADPVARRLYAEIASIEEQHVTQYGSLQDPSETALEKWVLHELTEVYNYANCASQESNARIRSIWERFLDYELGHLHYAMDLMREIEGRDPQELVPAQLPEPIRFESQRDFVRQVLAKEIPLRANGPSIVSTAEDPQRSVQYRAHLNSDGSPSDTIALGYRFMPGTELSQSERFVRGEVAT